MVKGVETKAGSKELGFDAASRFAASLVVELDLVEDFLNADEEGLSLVDLRGTEKEGGDVLVQSESGFLRLNLRFRSDSIVRFWCD